MLRILLRPLASSLPATLVFVVACGSTAGTSATGGAGVGGHAGLASGGSSAGGHGGGVASAGAAGTSAGGAGAHGGAVASAGAAGTSAGGAGAHGGAAGASNGGGGAGGAAGGCTESGGTLSSAMCCDATDDFPNSCLTGACGCAPDNSHEVQICQCPANQCFDGTRCR